MSVIKNPKAAQAPHRAPQYLQPCLDAINWAQSTEGQKGMMVKTKMATYMPRFRVGTNSDVTARAVSSLMPAPTPASAMPPGALSVWSLHFEKSMSGQCFTDKDVHGVRGAGDDHSQDEECCPSQRHITSAHQIGHRSDEWANGCQCQ